MALHHNGRDVLSTTSLLSEHDLDPILEGTSASMVNGALNAFALAASIELDRGLRVNVVSPGVITEALGTRIGRYAVEHFLASVPN